MKKLNFVFLALILAIGIFLRVYKIDTNYFFTGELGKELLYTRQFIVGYSFPLVGMPTSHEWLNYGPIYYWILIPIFKLFNGNPFILFWTALTVSVLGLILNYFVFRKIAGEKVALISTLVGSISPLLIWATRLSKLHVFFFVLIPVFTYLLYLIWNGNKKWVIPAGIVYGIMFSFHFSQIPILGVVALLFWIKKNNYNFYDWLKFGVGVLIPNITLIWRDRNLALWLPYRIISSVDKNPFGTLQLFNEFLGKNIFWNQNLWVIGSIVFLIIFAHYCYQNRHNLTKDFLPFYLVSSISLMLLANVLHGTPPIHYFLPIFTVMPILFAIYLNKIRFWPVILGFIFFVNLVTLTKDPVFYGNVANFDPQVDLIPYVKQIALSSFIVSDANGSSFFLKRIGPFDYFPENYSQNYKYLVLWKGGKLVDNSSNVYTITEDSKKGELSVTK